ncbi:MULTISPECIES: ATP synthase F1 subunit gamma [unclassified Mycoplasma]|uniref:ATP synthase F1 subunit gamma n=1 Tax=unclassified Mycoplasma TaxID=2683645 RepID=UPI001C0F8EC4|nr:MULTISPECIES: ATP synthase F1 subunit gamma [unclassified Mycoplasma]MBU4692782.1 F0F1 ATP synthase subunit gamma [Mycoplasma sp. CSL7491-lung]MCU4706618.1 ATP synthase F1 subunit gamma [Mycoplasma sp. CSL7503-lung]
MPNLNSLKNRINVVSNTQKITNAMELVSTSKLRKMRNDYINIISYQESLQETFDQLIANIDENDFYAIFPKNSDVKSKLFILVTSDLGLCGSYNHNAFQLLRDKVSEYDQIIVLGGKGISLLASSSLKSQVIKQYSNIGDKMPYKLASEISKLAMELYKNKEINSINLVYTKFINNINQDALCQQIFPFDFTKKENVQTSSSVIEFEPNAETVLSSSVPLFLASTIYCLSSNSKISETASRRNAMENATNNATELISDLKLEYNRERQSKITQELTEIVAGADAT